MALLPDTDPVKGGWEKNQSELCTLVQAGHPRAQSAAIPVDQQGWPTWEQQGGPLQASPVMCLALVSSNRAE